MIAGSILWCQEQGCVTTFWNCVGVELQAQPLGNVLEECQGQETFPKSLPTPLADRLAPSHPPPLPPASCNTLRNTEFQMWDWVGK